MAKKITKKSGPVPHKISERGLQLEIGHQAQFESNINRGKSVEISDDVRVNVGQKCPVCKMRVRGLNHTKGMHHKNPPKHNL